MTAVQPNPCDASMGVYLQLSNAVGRASRDPLMRALRWVQSPGVASPLRVGFDSSVPGLPARLPSRLRGPQGEVEVTWLESTSAGRSHGWFRAENTHNSVGPGTLTAVLRDGRSQALFGLTAGHVLAGDPQARIGNRVALSSPAIPNSAVNGRLHIWAPDLGGAVREADIDAGLMTLDETAISGLVDDLDWPSGWSDAVAGDAVRLLTRFHQLPGRVVSRITVPMEIGNPPVAYMLRDVLCCDIEGGTEAGDSGAALWNEQRQLVGLLVGAPPPGTYGNAIVTPIGRVLSWSGCEPVLTGQPLLSEGRDSAPAPVAYSAFRTSVAAPTVAAGAVPMVSVKDLDVLARTMWAEARGEPDAKKSMGAVAHVVINRVEKRSWWGRTISDVCTYPWQFSCWNANDRNRNKLIAVTKSDVLFALANTVVTEILSMTAQARRLADPTGLATHYYADSIRPPAWIVGATYTGRIGHHLFYRDVR